MHGRWQHCLDLQHKCLNINVGVDAWRFKMLSEDDLVKYIDKLLRDTSKLKRAVVIEGKVHIQ